MSVSSNYHCKSKEKLFEIEGVSNKVQLNIFRSFVILFFFHTFTLRIIVIINTNRYGK